jgi:hypothetical protein
MNAVQNVKDTNQAVHTRGTLSLPSLRALEKIGSDWHLNRDQLRRLIDEPSKELFSSWLREPQHALLADYQIKRISYLLSIYRVLPKFVEPPQSIRQWLVSKNDNLVFNGAKPLDYLMDGDLDALHSVLFLIT